MVELMGRGTQFLVAHAHSGKENSALALPRRTVFIFILTSKENQEKAAVN